MIEHFSTRSVDASDKLAFWNRLMEETYSGLVVDPGTGRFDAQIARWQLGDVCLTRPKSAAARVSRRISGQEPAAQKLVVHLLHSGHGRVLHRGHEALISAGDIVVCANDEPYVIEIVDDHEVLVIEVERTSLASRLPDVDDHLGRCISGRTPSARLLRDFLLSLWREGAGSIDGTQSSAYSSALIEMLAAGMQPCERIMAPNAPLFERMKRVVEARMGEAGLTPSRLADELGVSLRSLQIAAAECGTTPVAYIAQRRLELAAQRLVMDQGSTITNIAFDCGFSDSAYFTRRFAEHFGMSPRRFRMMH